MKRDSIGDASLSFENKGATKTMVKRNTMTKQQVVSTSQKSSNVLSPKSSTVIERKTEEVKVSSPKNIEEEVHNMK